MNPKKIVTVVLLLFVLASLGYLAYKEFGGRESVFEVQESASFEPVQEHSGCEVRVYYFHTNTRCFSCYKIETLTETTLLEDFSVPLEEGLVSWLPINVEEPENEHYVEEYEIYTKHVILSEVEDGEEVRWKDLPKVWDLLNDEETFREYVRDELNGYLEEKA